MVTIGVDIGITGAVAIMVDGHLRDVADIPSHVASTGSVSKRVDPAALAAVLRAWRACYGVDSEYAVMERVSAMPKQGTSSVFSLGHSAGVCQGVLATLGVPHELVAPQTWKRAFGLGRDKSQSQAVASQLFPEHAGLWALAKGHNRAEAALLAAYAWRTRG